MTVKSVLLVDDEADIRRIGQIGLQRFGGMEVRLASCADEAVQSVNEGLPDVILLDVMMPGIDGPETMSRIREASAGRPVPVIFMTAKAQTHEVEHYLSLGALGVIRKPFDPLTLAQEVRAIVERASGPK